MNTAVVLLALCLDRLLGEPRSYHPLVGLGFLAGKLETLLNRGVYRVAGGVLAVVLLAGGGVLAGFQIERQIQELGIWIIGLIHAGVLYLCIGWRSLREHAAAVERALSAGELHDARRAVSLIVSRDCRELDESAVAVAATESVLENGNDALFAALFWYLVAGLPGVLAYRVTNTLDALWGYRSTRFLQFGWAAARLDDLLNYIPARLTALSYAICGHALSALHCWRLQARHWDSPNAGPVMAAGAGSLQLRLGGEAIYNGQREARPVLGVGDSPDAMAIERSIRLLGRALLLWVVVIALVETGMAQGLEGLWSFVDAE